MLLLHDMLLGDFFECWWTSDMLIDHVVQRADGLVRVEERVDDYLSVEEHVKRVREAAEGLVDATVETDISHGEITYVKVVGWRTPTADEVVQLHKQKQATDRAAREQLRRLRRDHPDLFDGKGRPKEDSKPHERDPEEIPF